MLALNYELDCHLNSSALTNLPRHPVHGKQQQHGFQMLILFRKIYQLRPCPLWSSELKNRDIRRLRGKGGRISLSKPGYVHILTFLFSSWDRLSRGYMFRHINVRKRYFLQLGLLQVRDFNDTWPTRGEA